MELATILQKRISIVAILGISAFLGLLWSVGDGVVQYASLYDVRGSQSQVLGESTDQPLQCIKSETFATFFDETQKTVTLYAPDKTLVFSLSSLASCFDAIGCASEGFSCSSGLVTLNKACVTKHFEQYPLAVEQKKVVSGVGAVAQVQVQDWAVNYENLVEQLFKAVESEVKYCQVIGQEEQTRQNIGNLQLVVGDELPSMEGSDFTKRFVEIDASKEKLYFWNDGIYQTIALRHGARLPKEAIYNRSDIDFQSILDSVHAAFIIRNTQNSDYVVVHK